VYDEQGASALGTVFVTVDGVSDPPGQNPANAYDVNGDGFVSPIDPLILINHLNTFGPGPVPTGDDPPPFLDPSGNNLVTNEDVLLVITELNRLAVGGNGEGEGPSIGVGGVGGGLDKGALQTSELVLAQFAEPGDRLAAFGPATARQLPSAAAGSALEINPERAAVAQVERRDPADRKSEVAPADGVFTGLDLDSDLDDTLDLIAGDVDRADTPTTGRDAWFRTV
jgi:hypothetical protein